MSFATTTSAKRPKCPYVRHGGSKTQEHRSWRAMKDRCFNKRHPQYKDYGGRGIKICTRWLKSFSAFLEDMGPAPLGYTLERKKTDKDYTPDNCRWASRKEQNRNRSCNRFLTAFGRRLTLAAWADETGIKSHTIAARIDCYGWSERDALTVPKGARRPEV